VPAKTIFWVGTSLEDIRGFPADARRIAGHQLHLVQQGLDPVDWKPMPSVGSGVYELRIRTRLEHRVFYIAKLSDRIYVLHAFEKRTRKTPQSDIELGRSRLSQVVRQRRLRKE
jgi:phage-related protein